MDFILTHPLLSIGLMVAASIFIPIILSAFSSRRCSRNEIWDYEWQIIQRDIPHFNDFYVKIEANQKLVWSGKLRSLRLNEEEKELTLYVKDARGAFEVNYHLALDLPRYEQEVLTLKAKNGASIHIAKDCLSDETSVHIRPPKPHRRKIP